MNSLLTGLGGQTVLAADTARPPNTSTLTPLHQGRQAAV